MMQTTYPSTDDLTKPLPNQGELDRVYSATRSAWGLSIALALAKMPHVYSGTVTGEVVARRRAANKVARKSRRINRKRGA